MYVLRKVKRISLCVNLPFISCMCAKLFQSCPTLYNPMDHSPPGSSVHGVLQAWILDWVAMPLPGDRPHSGTELASLTSSLWQVDSLPLAPPGKPMKESSVQFSSVQSLSCVWLFANPWITARQACLSITNSQSLPKLMSIESGKLT